MKSGFKLALLAAVLLLPACSGAVKAQSAPAEVAEGQPYVLKDTQVWTVPDPKSGRSYQVFVSLPASYAKEPGRRYPVVYVTDADYAFPVVRSISRRVGANGEGLEDFILVGLSYAVGDDPVSSRRRDYTLTPNGPSSAPKDQVHGQGAAYADYVVSQALPFVDGKFRTDPARRVYMGHSYGALLGAQVLFTKPETFSHYILGSPSLWYDKRHMFGVEARYAETHKDLPADVFLYIGAFETVKAGDPRYTDTDMVGDNQRFEQTLKARNYPGLRLASTVVEGEDHLTVFPSGFTRGIKRALPPRKIGNP
ncbi:alpha/beta hydrolase [Caulobacter mirabilis]|uniref:Esterase n=1 Tax=Caulobacter mirabilis TaxID=69666 RepID=A0A2D2AYS8_9CAUL|nr:alpha/beta hydrolase-fold protein [Caulobacter mirabilis]ATQ43153.1 esterase [Caulobacter mirabilis]